MLGTRRAKKRHWELRGVAIAAVRFRNFIGTAVSAVLMRTAALRAVTSAMRDSTCQGSRATRANSTGYCTRAALSSVPICRAYTSEADSYRTLDEAVKADMRVIESSLYPHSTLKLPRYLFLLQLFHAIK